MKSQRGHATLHISGFGMIAIVCAIFCCARSNAQSAGDPAKVQMQEMNRREIQLNTIGPGNAPTKDPRRSQAVMDEVSEDFQRILTLHNEIVRAITAHRPLSVRFIKEATGEIRKRSTRLQSSLRLPKSETSAEPQPNENVARATTTNDKLLLLCRTIENFVRNPIIENPGTVDAAQLEKARRDLQSVVELSEEIKKQVDKQKE